MLHSRGDLMGAEPLLREGADGLTALRGAQDTESLTSRAAFASLLLSRGEYAEAEPRLKELCETSLVALGEGSDTTRQAHARYGSCLEHLGRAPEHSMLGAPDAALYVC